MKIIFTYIKKYKKEFVILFLLTLIISGISGVLPIISQAIFDQGILDKNIKLIIVFSILILTVVKNYSQAGACKFAKNK